MALAAVATAASPSSTSLRFLTGQLRPKWALVSSISASYSSSPITRKLVLYSKPGCCLCDGLKEKLQAAFLLFRFKEILPRLSPRLAVELVHKKIAAALRQ